MKIFLDFIKRNHWIFAKTMPDNPHWHLVINKLSNEDNEIVDDFKECLNIK